MGAHEEQRDGAGTRMTADHRAVVVDQKFLNPQQVFDILGRLFGILPGVAMGEEDVYKRQD